MEFQILDHKGRALTIGELDKEAAEFWKVEYSQEKYASFAFGADWFNWIGYSIARQKTKGKQEWCTIIGEISDSIAICKNDSKSYFDGLQKMKPMFDLVFYWKSKGYIPVTL